MAETKVRIKAFAYNEVGKAVEGTCVPDSLTVEARYDNLSKPALLQAFFEMGDMQYGLQLELTEQDIALLISLLSVIKTNLDLFY